ncbi:MAG: ferritin-like domain-containing protein [Planctomycetaceae bacterium]|nr:ferritin-like domain-containing protein [Planctomycetaceae bacterium]
MQTLLDHVHWIEHFRRNQEKRDEPDWNADIVLPADTIRKLVKSLEQFELGDGGGPGYLIAWDREKFLQAPGNRELVDLWFQEEHEHSRLLGKLVQRFHGRSIQSHWSFAVFCAVRKWLGIRFELRTLLLTEIVSNVYYRLLHRYGNDPALLQVCRLIIRDETGHIAFHRDRLARRGSQHRRIYGYAWQMLFKLMGLAAGTMLWVNHGPALCQLGATTEEFYREILKDMSQFIITLRRDVRAYATITPATING